MTKTTCKQAETARLNILQHDFTAKHAGYEHILF